MNRNKEPQIAGAVLMIRPVRFQSNPITAESNRFQGKTSATPEQQQAAAARQFEAIAAALAGEGIRVISFDDTPEPHTPDAIFPNNWVSFHADGTVVLYPMLAENRRTERRMDIIDSLAEEHGFDVRRIIDLSHHEQEGHYLEGTGSMVLDRSNRIAYACLSPRTHLDALGDFAQRMDYEVVAFDAVDRDGAAIYHTNVLMNVGESLAVICDVAIPDRDQRDAVMKSLASTGHEVLPLTLAQLESFAGNMLELRRPSGKPLLAMSEQARKSLSAEQIRVIQKHARIVSAPIDDIERSAGGSVRCMLAEIHLPTTNDPRVSA
ncbi:MAG TPA: arginine deiminase-related protein [Woeseiaceae bacterium]|nr:arginine deiminase-related protein [Woeseiaceae bacterium]